MTNLATTDLASKRPLAGGFYTPAEVSRLLRIGTPGLVTRWSSGDYKSQPALVRQYPGVPDVGFRDLDRGALRQLFSRQGGPSSAYQEGSQPSWRQVRHGPSVCAVEYHVQDR